MVINPDTLEIEIVDAAVIDGGIEVFARAWSDGEQIGFGKDGSVDIERFRIFNPPILVADPDGDIVNVTTDSVTGEEIRYRYREDPQEATLQVVAHNIVAMKHTYMGTAITPGKRGNTTSTFYPDGGAGGATKVDGDLDFRTSSNWTTTRDATTATNVRDSTSGGDLAGSGKLAGGQFIIWRSFFMFDTSPIGSDTVTAATFSFRGNTPLNGDNDGDDFIVVVPTTPAATNDLVATDFPNVGTTELSNRIDVGSLSNSVYNDFTFNSAGLAAVNGSGITKLGAREGHDLLNLPYAGSNGTFNRLANGAYAENAGTTDDPKLVVEHEAGGGPTPQPSRLMSFF